MAKTINDFINKIFNDKWENILPLIPDNSVDIVITSPPYCVDLGNNKFRGKDKGYDVYDDNMPYEEYLTWISDLFYNCNRVLKTGGRLCVNIGDGKNGKVPTHSDFTHILTREICRGSWSAKVSTGNFKPFEMLTTIVWDKNQIGARTAWGSFQSPSQPSFPTPFEFIIVVSKGVLKHEGDKNKISVSKNDFINNSNSLWKISPETQMMKKYDHPAMFPKEIPRRLIDQLSYEEDVVLDPFSGAGTTCAVAKEMNRRYIGIEMSEKYVDISRSRLSLISSSKKIMVDGKSVEVPDWLATKE